LHLSFETLLDEYGARGSGLRELLTPKQREVEADTAWLRAVCGGRQWGKSTWTAVAHSCASVEGATSLAIAPTITKARDLLLVGFEWLSREAQYHAQWRASDWSFALPSGGTVKCMGMSTQREAEKVRGYTPPFVTVEECGTYKPELLKFGLESCITPAQSKWYRAGGRGCALIGTPGLTIQDYWHELCQGQHGASVHHATMLDNPHVPNAREFMAKVLRDNAWTEASPRFRREFLGQFCAESDSMCYASAWDQVVLPQEAAPEAGYTILGLDLGATRSPSAWVVMRITRELVDGELTWITHIIHAEKALTLTVHDVAAKTGSLRKRFGIQHMRGDSAGLGAMTLETLRTKFIGVPVENAEKPGQKLARIWLLASMLQRRVMRVYEGARPLIDELLTVPWNDEHDDHHESFPDHACDAAHYASELVSQYTKMPPLKGPEPGSPEARRREMDRYKRDAIQRNMNEDS